MIDAKTVITLLGTHGSSSQDYAPRLWQGMLGEYCEFRIDLSPPQLPVQRVAGTFLIDHYWFTDHHRWASWYDMIEATLLANTTYTEGPWSTVLRDYQDRWLLNDTRYRTEVAGNAVEISKALYANYSHLLRGRRVKADDEDVAGPPNILFIL